MITAICQIKHKRTPYILDDVIMFLIKLPFFPLFFCYLINILNFLESFYLPEKCFFIRSNGIF